MRVIAEKLNEKLSNDNRFEPYLLPALEGDENSKLYQAVDLSKNWGCAYHLCLHSDGGYAGSGASGRYQSTGGLNFGKPIFDEMCALTPWTDMSLAQTTSLYELKATNAVAFLLEVSFHDQPLQAKWMHESVDAIVEAIYKGICQGCGVSYRETLDWQQKYETLWKQYYAFRQAVIDQTNIFI